MVDFTDEQIPCFSVQREKHLEWISIINLSPTHSFLGLRFAPVVWRETDEETTSPGSILKKKHMKDIESSKESSYYLRTLIIVNVKFKGIDNPVLTRFY